MTPMGCRRRQYYKKACFAEEGQYFAEMRSGGLILAKGNEPAAAGVGKVSTMSKKIFFGFAIADSMFNGDVATVRREVSADEAKGLIEAGVEPCLNPSHTATIAAMTARYGIDVKIPEAPPKVVLGHGDQLLVMGVRGLPRLTDRHEYNEEEVASATFTFSLWSIFGKEELLKQAESVCSSTAIATDDWWAAANAQQGLVELKKVFNMK